MITVDPAVTAAQIKAARVGGRFAGRRRLAATSCPYDPAGDAGQRTLARAWLNAYLTYNPPVGTVSYDD